MISDLALLALAVDGNQTVPRAEATAAAEALIRAAPAKITELGVDATYVTNGFGDEAKTDERERGCNSDLWLQIHENRGDAIANKITSHQRYEEVEAGAMLIEDWLGNGLADLAAGFAQKLRQPEVAYISEAEKWDTRAFLAATRVAAIEAQQETAQ